VTRRSSYPRAPAITGLATLITMIVIGTSLLDPHAAERDPGHDHVVVGGTALEQARALSLHLRESRGMVDGPTKTLPRPSGLQSHHRARIGEFDAPPAAKVFSVGQGNASASIVSRGRALLVTWAADATMVPFPPGALVPPSAVLPAGIVLSVSEPPPRAS
jgi:hypothetical protein